VKENGMTGNPAAPIEAPGGRVAAVAAVAAGGQQRLVGGEFDGAALDDVSGPREQVAVRVADRERVQQQPTDGVRDLGLPGDGVADQLPGSPEQMRQARLVAGFGEAPVGRPPVALQHPAETFSQEACGLLVAAARSDQVHGHAVVTDEHPQPLTPARHAPPGLIGGDRRALAHGEHERLAGRLGRPREPADRLMQGAGSDGDAHELQDLGDLAHRDPEFLVELRGDRDRPRPDLRAGRADRVAGLIGVAALRAPAAAPAAPAADPKAAHMPADPADLLLVLIDLVLELKLAPAARARIGQPDEDLLIDMIGDRPMRSNAVVLAAATPRPGRVLLRLALGKRRRLTLPGPPRLLQLPPQPRVLGRQTLDPRTQPRIAPIAASATHTPATTPRACRAAHTPTLHTRKVPCTQEEPCRYLRRPDRVRPALTHYR
jgi:hypothetical protein